MRPNIRVPAGAVDLEKPRIHTKGLKIGTGQLIDDAVTAAKIADGTIVTASIADDTITPAKLRHDAQFSWGFDGGDLSGLTEWSFGTWVPKVIDGGAIV
jgi:hypothetical protein